MKRALLATLLFIILVSCSGDGTPPEQLSQSSLPATPTLRSRTPPPPTPTAAAFELRPTWTPAPTPTLSDITTTNGFGFGPYNFPPDINPLTGLQVSDPELLNRRPMVIKITNFPRSVRPQWGLTIADNIFEYYLEDELTRFIGVFYGQDGSRVGPIRSARPFDEQVVRMYKAIFAFGYADDRVVDPLVDSDLLNLLVIERPNNCPPLCRIGPKNAYNTLYTDTALLSQHISARGVDNGRQNLDGMRFEDITLITGGGGVANRLAIRYSPSSYLLWEYEPLIRRYLRSQDTMRCEEPGQESYAPLIDSLTGQPVTADNIVILLTPMGYYYKSHSTEIYDFALVGKGAGFALREGKIFQIIWKRPTMESLLTILLPSGGYYPLKPGNVWFEVLSTLSTHEVLPDQTWKFTFELPPEK